MCSGDRARIVDRRVVRFADAADLWIHLTAGATSRFSFTWCDESGKPLCMFSGVSDSGGRWFARRQLGFAAESAWTTHRLERAMREISADGALEFRLREFQPFSPGIPGEDRGDRVRIGSGYDEFRFGGENARCEARDIASATLREGRFTIQHRNARWYRPGGKFSSTIANVPNMKLFVAAFERLAGISLGS